MLHICVQTCVHLLLRLCLRCRRMPEKQRNTESTLCSKRACLYCVLMLDKQHTYEGAPSSPLSVRACPACTHSDTNWHYWCLGVNARALVRKLRVYAAFGLCAGSGSAAAAAAAVAVTAAGNFGIVWAHAGLNIIIVIRFV